MAVRFTLNDELFSANPNPNQNSITITEEPGGCFMNINIKVQIEGTPISYPLSIPPSPSDIINEKRKYRESRNNTDNLLVAKDGCGVKIEKTDFTDSTGAAILKLTARLNTKIPHTGG